jgi:membrane-associated phospholipid phosphatase
MYDLVMHEENVPTRSLVIGSLAAVLLCAMLVAISYFFVDRPVAWFVHNHVSHSDLLIWPTLVPPFLVRLAPWAILVAFAWWAWHPRGGAKILLAFSLSLIVAEAIKDQLKWCFGRYWPETWVNNNPSLIQNGAYGLHPFHKGIAYESFPSGHTLVVFSLASIAWLLWPRWRWLWSLGVLAVVVGLLGMNFHFVGDIVAGAFLGSITGVCTIKSLCRSSGPPVSR